MSKVSDNGVMKARVRQSLLDTCCSKKITARYVFFQVIGYQRLAPMYFVPADAQLMDRKEKLSQVQENLQKVVEDSESLEISW